MYQFHKYDFRFSSYDDYMTYAGFVIIANVLHTLVFHRLSVVHETYVLFRHMYSSFFLYIITVQLQNISILRAHYDSAKIS